MSRCQPGPREDRHRGQGKRRLGDVIVGPRLQLRAEIREFLLAGGRANQHAVAARSMHFLDDQLVEIVQDIGQRFGLAATPCRDILQKRLLACVKLDDVRHIAVDRLVVGDPCARRIGQRDAAGAVDIHDARDPKGTFRIEVQRIEKIVIDPAVKDVDGR